jgi:hypothetical protein
MLTDIHPNPAQVIVSTEDCDWCSVNAVFAHHRTFPEICGEGETPREAAERLVQRLTSGLDAAPCGWRRECVERAIEDVRAFAELAL